MAKVFILFVLFFLFVVVFGKHIHPRSMMFTDEDSEDAKQIASDVERIPIEVIRHIKPSRFVPVNNVFFFQKYSPCEEGFERDLLGVCREVWE